MFAKIKEWRLVATRYDWRAHTFMRAIHIAASFILTLPRKSYNSVSDRLTDHPRMPALYGISPKT